MQSSKKKACIEVCVTAYNHRKYKTQYIKNLIHSVRCIILFPLVVKINVTYIVNLTHITYSFLLQNEVYNLKRRLRHTCK